MTRKSTVASHRRRNVNTATCSVEVIAFPLSDVLLLIFAHTEEPVCICRIFDISLAPLDNCLALA